MNIVKINIEEIKMNPDNPRIIRDEKFKKLVKSIIDFPEMLEIRPIVVDENNVVLGGNMRLKACKEAGLEIIPIIKAEELNEEQKKEFIIKDNQAFGEWDSSSLSNWSKDLLLKSGFEEWEMMDIFGDNLLENNFTSNIEGSNFNPDVVNVDDYIKQNILFFNELMIEFIDDDIKKAIRNIKSIEDKHNFLDEIRNIILRYGQN